MDWKYERMNKQMFWFLKRQENEMSFKAELVHQQQGETQQQVKKVFVSSTLFT